MILICNSSFSKLVSYLTTYRSSDHVSQINYILFRKQDSWLPLNVKSFSGKECTLQHRLFISDFKLQTLRILRSRPIWNRRIWKLQDILPPNWSIWGGGGRVTDLQYTRLLEVPTRQLTEDHRPNLWMVQSPNQTYGDIVTE